MTYSINGIGTGYTKSLNAHGRAGVCPACGTEQRLTSFDTHEAFIVFFLPLIKLKHLRVIGMCPSCTRHRTVPHAEWRMLLDNLITNTKTLLAADPTPPVDDVVAKLHELMALGDVPSFDTLFPLFEAKLDDDASGLRELGDAAHCFEKPELATKLYERSLAVRESEETHRALALHYALLVDPEHAQRHLDGALRAPDAAGTVLLVVDAFQMRGKYVEAQRLLELLQRAQPAAATDKLFREALAVCERELKKKEPTPTWRPRLSRTRFPSVELAMGKRRNTRKDVAIGAVLTATFLVGYVGYCELIARTRTLYVVNGTDVAYEVDVDTRKVSLEPGEMEALKDVPEGKHNIAVSVAGRGPAVSEIDMSSFSLLRPFVQTCFVLNPDASAAFLYESAQYGVDDAHADPDDNWTDVVSGRQFFDVEAHFPFRPWPTQIKVDRGSSVTRLRLSVVKGGVRGAVELLKGAERIPQARELLENRLRFDPNDSEARELLTSLGT